MSRSRSIHEHRNGHGYLERRSGRGYLDSLFGDVCVTKCWYYLLVCILGLAMIYDGAMSNVSVVELCHVSTAVMMFLYCSPWHVHGIVLVLHRRLVLSSAKYDGCTVRGRSSGTGCYNWYQSPRLQIYGQM